MNVTVKIENEEKKLLDSIKKARFTKNTSQIIREALRYYHRFLFNQIIHTSIGNNTQA